MRHLNILLFTIFAVFSMHSIAFSQEARFGAAFVAGLNMSQIQGDNLAGYHKAGLTAGIRGITYLNDLWNLNIELLYTQKGSRNGLFEDNFVPRQGMDFDYIEVPVTIEIKDWVVEEDGGSYAKVSAHAGFSYGRLIRSGLIEYDDILLDAIEDNDLSFLLGLRFRWSKHFAVCGRYSRSIIPIAQPSEMANTNSLIPYSMAIRLEYIL